MAAASAAIVCLLWAGSARADDGDRPWAVGVSAQEQATATSLFNAGNDLLDQNLFAPALELYRKALKHWDHPSIRYNAAVALINLERPIEAYQNLEAALRYGDRGLSPDIAKQAHSYERLLQSQLVHVEIDCGQTDVAVALDGHDFLRCPGKRKVLLLAGEHRVTAARAGFLTLSERFVLLGGASRQLPIQLKTLDQATVLHRRWAAWKPWAVAGGGVAVALAGLGFELQSRATYQSYDDALAVLCADQPCSPAALPANVTAAEQRAHLQNRIGVGLVAVGGAVLSAGIVLAILNRPTVEQVGYGRTLALAPLAGSGRLGVQASWRF